MVKEWRKVLMTKTGSRVFINLRKSELLLLGFNNPNKLLYRSMIEKPNKIILEFKEEGVKRANTRKKVTKRRR